MVERPPRVALCGRAGLILCGLLLVLACLLARPEGASAGLIGPPLPETCDIVVSKCAKVTVFADGNGSGTITSSPEGINCTVTAGVESGTCVFSFLFSGDSLTVTATITASTGSELLLGVRGGKIAYSTKTVSDGDDVSIGDYAIVLTRHNVVVRKTGAGSGKVTSTPAGIDCTDACSREFDYGTQLALTATPDAGAVFKAWTGACAGQGATCTLTIQAATATNVVFELPTAGGGTTGGGTSGGSTETTLGANTSGTAGTTTSGKADKAVTVSVVRTRSSKSPLGKRIVQLELNLEENVSATLTLLRGKKTLLAKQLTRIRPGNRLLTLVIPKRVGQGKATLVFRLKDPAGNTFSGRRSIKIAAL